MDEVSRRFDVLDLHIEFRTPKLVHAELRVGSAVFQKQYADRHGLRPQAYRLRARGGDAGNVRLSDGIINVHAAASLRHRHTALMDQRRGEQWDPLRGDRSAVVGHGRRGRLRNGAEI